MQKKIIIICSILFLLVIFICLFCIFTNKKVFFKVENRYSEIKQAKKHFKEDNIIGWIRVQGTGIDYPILGYAEDYPVEEIGYAWIDNNDDKYHNVLNVYGHNLLNLGPFPSINDDEFYRFESLMAFIYYDFAKENKYVQLTMDGKDYVYQIFAAGIVRNYYVTILPKTEYNEEQKDFYLKVVKENTIYDYDVKVENTDNFITLVTCTRFYGSQYDSFYIAAKLVDNNEKSIYNNYNVSKNKKYKKVEKVLKGDVSNEKDDNS